MSRASDLFDTIINKGEKAIDEFIHSRKTEELFLDFKRSSDNGSGGRLSLNDRNNFAKAVSGFGNSEGGIIVWGVDCSRDNSGAGVARIKFPVEDAPKFASWLNSAVSGVTIPPHTSVQNEPILIDGERGFVITLIPKSVHTPHQVIGKKQYYIRAGSDFLPTPHDVLAGMFGRRPQPHVIHQFIVGPIEVVGKIIQCNIGFALKNIGPGIASDVFITLMTWYQIGRNCQVELKPSDLDKWDAHFSFGTHVSMISKSDMRLPPDALWSPLTLILRIQPPFEEKLSIEGTVGSSYGRSYKFKFENTPESISQIYAECHKAHSNGTLEGKRFEFVKRIMNRDFEKLDN